MRWLSFHHPFFLLGVLLLGLALVLPGCDTTAPQPQSDEKLITITNDLGERLTTFDGKRVPLSEEKTSAKAGFTLRAVARIEPPNNGHHASHLQASGDDFFVAYKIPGPTFGGGVDILDRASPTSLPNEDNALRTPDLDVQEVAYDVLAPAPHNLYIAGAVDFGLIEARDYGNTPAVMIRAQLGPDGNVLTHSDGDVRVVEEAMPNRLVKSLTLTDPIDNAHDIYTVTDSSALYQFDGGLDSREVTAISDPNAEFRSIASFRAFGPNSPAAYGLTNEGEIHIFDTDTSPTSPVKGIGGLGPVNDFGIARLDAHTHEAFGTATSLPVLSNTPILYAALHSSGLAVMVPLSGPPRSLDLLFRKTDQTYVSVTPQDYGPPGGPGATRVFAAGPNGTIDVYEVTDAIASAPFDPSTGLELEGSFDLGGLEEEGIGPIGSGQVNQIVVDNGYLYVAAGDEGVVVLEIAENEGDIF